MQPVYLICGVSGSGKSWVCGQLKDKFTYVRHDQFFEGPTVDHRLGTKRYLEALNLATNGSQPVVTECPFAERDLREKLEKLGIKVIPYFVIEAPDLVRARFRAREGKEPGKNVITRAVTIRKRADEWKAPFGNSTAVLNMLKAL